MCEVERQSDRVPACEEKEKDNGWREKVESSKWEQKVKMRQRWKKMGVQSTGRKKNKEK